MPGLHDNKYIGKIITYTNNSLGNPDIILKAPDLFILPSSLKLHYSELLKLNIQT